VLLFPVDQGIFLNQETSVLFLHIIDFFPENLTDCTTELPHPARISSVYMELHYVTGDRKHKRIPHCFKERPDPGVVIAGSLYDKFRAEGIFKIFRFFPDHGLG
jgi:hypothetical protein